MVQIYKDLNPLDALATRTAIRVTRSLFASMPRGMTSSQLAERLETSRSSIHRALGRMEGLGLVRSDSRGMLVLHRIDTASPLVGPLFEMFNHERYLSVRQKIREALLLFGSQARGTSREMSDIDMCFVWRENKWDDGFQSRVRDLAFPYILVEPHCYSEDVFTTVPDLVVLDSILHGVSLHGHHYLLSTRQDLESIRKEVLLARLDGCRRILEMATQVLGAAKEHFEDIVEVGLTEIEMIIARGTTVSRREVEPQGDLEWRLRNLEALLARLGEKVWLV